MSWTALASIGMEGIETPSALARHIAVNRPAVSRLLKGLEVEGLIRREASRGDGRSVRLALTEAGRRKLEEVYPHADATNRHFSAKLSASELVELRRLLDKLVEGEGESPSAF